MINKEMEKLEGKEWNFTDPFSKIKSSRRANLNES